MSTAHRLRLAAPPLALLGASACASDSRAARAPARDSSASGSACRRRAHRLRRSSRSRATPARGASTPKPRLLTEAEQRVADGLVFAPSVIERFLVAARNKRLLLDVGRVDLEAKLDAQHARTVRRVAARVGPLSRVTHVRVRGTWGEETDSIVGYDVWNGRAVAVLAAERRTDSLLRRRTRRSSASRRARGASAERSSAAAMPAVAPAPAVACVRDSVAARAGGARGARARFARALGDGFPPLAVRAFAQATPCVATRRSAASGPWRAVVVVTSRTPAFDWSEERALLVAPDGKVAAARLRDLRLRAHESLVAFDADGDGDRRALGARPRDAHGRAERPEARSGDAPIRAIRLRIRLGDALALGSSWDESSAREQRRRT